MAYLEIINTPDDIKRLNTEELEVLAEEIREKIIETVAANGGHLASNLGITDVTVALHKSFSCPDDSLIFDVGHQAYAHKLITGRYNDFKTLRKAGGVTGFTNRDESKYDFATSGHCGTSLSMAIGVAEANKLAGSENWAVAVIGDGSLTNGMVYEGLEQLKDKNLRVMVILNDNEMSISKNVGGISQYLSKIRTSEGYFGFKLGLKKFFSKVPLIGKGLIKIATSIKEFIKRLFGAQTIFEKLGLEYIGPVDGNNLKKLLAVIEEAKQKKCPVLVHVKTIKGLGYEPAEVNPEKYHSTGGFEIDGKSETRNLRPKTFTNAVSELITAEAGTDERIAAITAAMSSGCGLGSFEKENPERFFDVGIAEEHAVTYAAGLAMGSHGKIIPFLFMYSTFTQRVFDQLWHDIGLQITEKNDCHIVFMVSHAGLIEGDGVTHQGIYDLSLISMVNGTTIYSPDNFEALNRSFRDSLSGKGLCVIRYPKGTEAEYKHTVFEDHDTWKVSTTGEKSGTVVITYGRISENVAQACDKCGCKTVVLRRLKPLPDDETFIELVNGSKKLIVIEEVIRRGGLGDYFLESYSEKNISVKAIDDTFVPSGDLNSLYKHCGLDVESLSGWIGKCMRE